MSEGKIFPYLTARKEGEGLGSKGRGGKGKRGDPFPFLASSIDHITAKIFLRKFL